MKRFSYNTTGLSPVLKKPHPTTKGQDRQKKEQNRSSLGLSKHPRKTTNNKRKQQQTTRENNNKQQELQTTAN
jgi:hypothetical protein